MDKLFSKVDNLWGYHQLKLAEDSSKVTAIITPWGVYRFLACPFGISTAPGEYQARMAHEILKDFYLNGAIVYIDDTVIYGRNVEEFLSILDRILSQMAAFNVRLKPSKCFFGMTSIEFLGHIFDVSGARLLYARVKGIQEWPKPTSVKGARSLIGISGLYKGVIKLYDTSDSFNTKKSSASEPFRMSQEGRDLL